MKAKIVAILIAIVLCSVIFSIVFFKIQPYTVSPQPVIVESSKVYFDIYDKPVMYELSILGTVKYAEWLNPWKRMAFEDSLELANQRIMDDYFQTNYIDRVCDDTIINTFDVSKYFSSDLSFDSVYFQIIVEKKIFLTGKPPL